MARRQDTVCQAPTACPQAYRLIKRLSTPKWPALLFWPPHHAHTLPARPWHPTQHPRRSHQPSLTWTELPCSASGPCPHLPHQPLWSPPALTTMGSKPGPDLPLHMVNWGLCPPSPHSLLNAGTVFPLQGCHPQSGPPSRCSGAPADLTPLPPKQSHPASLPRGDFRTAQGREHGGNRNCWWRDVCVTRPGKAPGGCVSKEPWGQAITPQTPCQGRCLGIRWKQPHGDR